MLLRQWLLIAAQTGLATGAELVEVFKILNLLNGNGKLEQYYE